MAVQLYGGRGPCRTCLGIQAAGDVPRMWISLSDHSARRLVEQANANGMGRMDGYVRADKRSELDKVTAVPQGGDFVRVSIKSPNLSPPSVSVSRNCKYDSL